jgi:hypothetical protein
LVRVEAAGVPAVHTGSMGKEEAYVSLVYCSKRRL